MTPITLQQVELLLVILFVTIYVLLQTAAETRIRRSSPQEFRVTLLRNETMANVMRYGVSVAAPTAADVVSRVLTVIVDGSVQSETVFPGSATDLGEVRVPQDANVELSLVDVDDSDNRSEPATLTFVAADTIPPGRPGDLGVTLLGEEVEG